MHICNNSVSEYYKLSHFVTILNNYIMFWLECIEIFTFFIWKYPEGYAGCAKKTAETNPQFSFRALIGSPTAPSCGRYA